ncbi:RHO1 GDP-GTP exchange protein 2 [Apophysomyces sp. BC1034]|nr:RHO1 GDP-GTP exchange protein 2 [Apophysomyces sp. BC1034]
MCYSSRCDGRRQGCYSPTCPHRTLTGKLRLWDPDGGEKPVVDWIEHVPEHVRNSLSPQEMKRQAAIAELLASEHQYSHDFDILHDIYAQPLLRSPCIEELRRQKVHDLVFSNYEIMAKLHRRVCTDLVAHRQVDSLFGLVGTILLKHVARLETPYVIYAAAHVKAMSILSAEIHRNLGFRRFVEYQNAHENNRKLGLRHFLTMPVHRIGRLRLLTTAILKYTTHDGEQLALSATVESLNDLQRRMNEATRKAQIETRLLQIASSLTIPQHLSVTLRQLLPDHAYGPEGQGMIALGTQTGVWVGPRDGSAAFHLVERQHCLQLALVNNSVVVMFGRHPKRCLVAYTTSALHSSTPALNAHVVKGSGVICCAVGTISYQPVLCYLKRRRRTGTVVLVLLVPRSFDEVWFEKRKEYRLRLREPYSVQIAYNAVYVHSMTEGVEHVDVFSSQTAMISHDTSIGFIPLPQGGILCGGLAAWTVEDSSRIEFQSHVKSIVISYPYLIAFSSSVIEVWHVKTFELVQAIGGHHIRCVYVSSVDDAAPLPCSKLTSKIHVTMFQPEDRVTRVYEFAFATKKNGLK